MYVCMCYICAHGVCVCRCMAKPDDEGQNKRTKEDSREKAVLKHL